MLRLVITLALLTFSSQAMAAARFTCDGADVLFHVSRTGPEPEAASATLEVRRGAQALSRDLRGDYVGGECLIDDRGQRLIAYQAYCGAPGCKEFANWGVVDPRTLREMVSPSDTSRDAALRLIGWALPKQINEVLSVRSGKLITIRPPKKPKKPANKKPR